MKLLPAFLIAVLTLLACKQPICFIPLIGILWTIRKKSRRIRGYIVIVLVFLLIGLVSTYASFPISGERVGLIIKQEENYVIVQTIQGRFHFSLRGHNFAIGDLIRFRGSSQELDFPTIEMGFDFNQYLRNLGVKQTLNISHYQWVYKFPIRINEIKAKIYQDYSDDTRTLVEAFIFNNKDYDNPIMDNFSRIDLIFLLSSSGMHLFLLMAITRSLLSLFMISETKRDLIPLFLLIPLWMLNLDRFIFYRLFLVKIFQVINHKYLKRHFDYLSILSSCGLIFLLINPFLLYNMSYYLSFGLSLFIYFVRPIMNRVHRRYRSLLLALSIYGALIPIKIMHSHVIYPLGMVLQLALTPLLGLYFTLAYLSVILAGRGAFVLNAFSSLIRVMSGAFPQLNSGLAALNIGFVTVCVLYALIFILVLSIESKHKPLQNMIIVTFSLSSLIIFTPLTTLVTKSVSFINVGQGDATLIQHGRTAVLIDTGGSHYNDIASDCLIPYFNSRQIPHLDAVIITHDDFDHNGALPELIQHFNVKKVIDSDDAFPLRVGPLTFINLNQREYFTEDNEKSLILYLEFMNKRWLFMGDASINNEKLLIESHKDLDIDVLKVGHHGSNTSTSLEFLRATTPSDAIISAGKNNFYGHPHESVLTSLYASGVTVKRTDVVGTIMYKSLSF